jgi:predicted amidohydrolase
VTIAAVQTRPRILRKAANLVQCLESMDAAAENGADLLVLPECALTGYCFSSLEESLSVAESIPGPSTDDVAARCRELNVYAVLGLLEEADGRCYNALAFLGPEGLVGKYRKTHLPYLGVDRFVAPGDTPLDVYDTAIGRIGLNICFDVRFPEPARVLALNGADLIALPTNWPEGAESAPDYLVNARAIENRVNYVAANRVGAERGF